MPRVDRLREAFFNVQRIAKSVAPSVFFTKNTIYTPLMSKNNICVIK